MNTLKIKSHVGRDILQSAQSFRTPEAAIWEYVVNSLQYVDKGVGATVKVTLDQKAKKVTIADNGSGMDRDGLAHFFTMHGENRERRKGVPGRGKFGTGKSAAFGIGSALTVDTVHDGVRQVVYVDRAMIDAADGNEVPVTFLKSDEPAPGEPNGTTVTISGVSVKLPREPVVSLIERYLSAFQTSSPVVFVNDQVCEIARPQAAVTRTFTPPANLADTLGDVELVVKAALAPLDAVQKGVQVTVGPGNLVAVVTAGVDVKEYGNRLFGTVDVPALDDPKYDPVSAYGNNRDLTLNARHPVALALTAFIGGSLEQVRLELVEEAKRAREDADAKRLRETTNAIEKVLNADLADVRDQLDSTMSNVHKRTPLPASAAGDQPDETSTTPSRDGETPGVVDGILGTFEDIPDPNVNATHHSEPTPSQNPGGNDASPAGRPDDDGDQQLTVAGRAGRQRPRGGMQVRADYLGATWDRSHWDVESRVITINLDHPVVIAAKALDDGEASFHRLCYEIAFTTYAIALADLFLERDSALAPSDVTYTVRDALRRVWANAGALYAA
ncbi:hypothetical protein CELL_01610 [Cellulomonas sp. T2.31MG-18]|uniref:ATP-binding protein n=1 Tax=Cellulomonas sp. T2.31MG-18 TaxID=3157619 RepID=UPI0035E7D8C5